MPRNVNGEYELPAGNPVVSGTIISTNWANDTMADLATALTNSLSRNGNGGMLAPFLNADGSESAPGIAWSNEPSTGFWRAGPQDMRASVSALATQRWNEQGSQLWRNSQWEEILTQTGGGGDTTINNLVVTGSFTSPGIDDNATSTAITIDASENVGVGNPSPQAKLEVSTGDNLDGDTIEVALGGTSGNTRRAIISKATAGDRDFSFYAAQGGSSSNTVFYRNATDETMRLSSSGNVGIGYDSPTSKLHVFDDGNPCLMTVQGLGAGHYAGLKILGRNSSNAAANWTIKTEEDLSLSVGTSTSEAMRIDSSGNVGLGGTPNSYPGYSVFTLNGTNGGEIDFENSSGTIIGSIYSSATDLTIASDFTNAISNSNIVFTCDGTERMRIDADGNVGIGEDAPAAKLHIKDNTAEPEALIQNEAFISGGQARLRLSTSTSPTRGCFVAGELESGGSSGGQPSSLVFATNTAFNNATERMRIDSAGNVGIGTDNPFSKLEVASKVAAGSNRPTHKGTLCIADYGNATSVGGGLEFHSNSGGGGGYGSLVFPLTDGALGFATRTNSANWSERMRIDSSGDVYFGTSDTLLISNKDRGAILRDYGSIQNYSGVNTCLDLGRENNGVMIQFYINGGNTSGGISTTQGGTPVFYASSDERLKDNITDHESELANVMSLRPTRWDWKKDEQGSGEGFIAQELEQTAWSDLVSEGEDGYKTVAGLGTVETRLIKAMQEQQAMIETLQAEVAALKGA